MPLPNIPGRLAYIGGTRPFPPSPRGKIEVGYITLHDSAIEKHSNLQDVISTKFIMLTQVRLDRTFVYWVHQKDARALFVPTNKVRPVLEEGDWYFGEKLVSGYVNDNSNGKDNVQGVVYVKNDAQIRWHTEGVSPARDIPQVIRPFLSPGDLAPIEFQGVFGDSPDCCDDE